MRWRKPLCRTGTPGHFFPDLGFLDALAPWVLTDSLTIYSEWVSEHSVFPENEVTQKIEFIQIMHITQVRQECNIGPLGQYSLVSCGEIALKSSNIQSQKNNKIRDLKYNLDFSYTERDTGVQDTPKWSLNMFYTMIRTAELPPPDDKESTTENDAFKFKPAGFYPHQRHLVLIK